jgi:hypothetical protein
VGGEEFGRQHGIGQQMAYDRGEGGEPVGRPVRLDYMGQ